ncbi:quinon protein alcohol dehydrogenase-like superfamily [Aspergillus karnatakaensis]|uniref:WD40 repeat domain-containing protein n=1 Tax=Aspergillus karnatakaensis TaxID=1810916 RepID=UPI003CCDB192
MLESGSDYGWIQLWDTATGNCSRTLKGEHPMGIWDPSTCAPTEIPGSFIFSTRPTTTMAFTSPGYLLVACHSATDREVGWTEFGQPSVFRHDGMMLAACSSCEGVVDLWDLVAFRRVHTLKAHDSEVDALAFRPDNKVLVSGYQDGSIKLWTVATGDCLQTLEARGYGVKGVALSPDGELVVSGNDD